MYDLFFDEPLVYFLKYVHLTQWIHPSVRVDTINKVNMCALSMKCICVHYVSK